MDNYLLALIQLGSIGGGVDSIDTAIREAGGFSYITFLNYGIIALLPEGMVDIIRKERVNGVFTSPFDPSHFNYTLEMVGEHQEVRQLIDGYRKIVELYNKLLEHGTFPGVRGLNEYDIINLGQKIETAERAV